jgi:processive 1,2-diacylglycerol beta-glucosyltransferase
LFVKAYLETLHLTPELWGFLYGLTQKNGQPATVKNFLGKLYMTKLKKLLFNYRPDFVICTHPFPCNAMSAIKEQGYNVPIAAVVTDLIFILCGSSITWMLTWWVARKSTSKEKLG